MQFKRFFWIILSSCLFMNCLGAKAFVSANFLLFGPTAKEVTLDRLQTLSELRMEGGGSAVNGICIPIFEDDLDQYARTREMLDQFSFNVITTTPMSADKDITSLDESIGSAGVQFLKERVLITKQLGGQVLTGALLFPELRGSPEIPIRPLESAGKQLEPPALTQLVDKRLRLAVARMQEVADFAAQYGITVANEYINHWEICGGNTFSSAIAFALEVDRPNFGILTDISMKSFRGKVL